MQWSDTREGIQITSQSELRVEEAPLAAATGDRESGASDDRAVDRELVSVLERDGFEPLAPRRLVPPRRRPAPEAEREEAGPAAPEAAATAEVGIDLEAGQGAVLLTEQGGLYRWALPAGEGGRDREGRALFEVAVEPLAPEAVAPDAAEPADAAERERGRLAEEAVRLFPFRFALQAGGRSLVRLLERRVRTGLVRWHPDCREWAPLRPEDLDVRCRDAAPRVLLFLHGTFSNTEDSFRGLGCRVQSVDLLAEAARGYDLLLGFDHPTLSVDPFDNAVALLELLEEIDWPAAPEIDVLAFSRGGLVARSLVEAVLPGVSFEGRIRRTVFVGVPHAGTPLARPEKWNELIDLYTNLLVAGARLASALSGSPLGDAVSVGVKGVGILVRSLVGTGASAEVAPGLAAMQPAGDFLGGLNREDLDPETEYHLVLSEFDHRVDDVQPGWKRRVGRVLAERFADRILGPANDLVVDVASMELPASWKRPRPVPEANRQRFPSAAGDGGSKVHHLSYFAQPATRDRLSEWLGLAVVTRGEDGTLGEPVRREEAAALRLPEDLELEVVWGDLSRAAGEVFAVGHYKGVLPVRAEDDLDRAISGVPRDGSGADESDEDRLLLRQHTRRGLLVGELGEVRFYPWNLGGGHDGAGGRWAAVCGMGHPGTFGGRQLRLLWGNLAWAAASLGAEELTTVLIGSGEGGMLDIEPCLEALLDGLEGASRGRHGRSFLKRVRIVEIDRAKSRRIHWQLERLLESRGSGGEGPQRCEYRKGEGGSARDEFRLGRLLAALAEDLDGDEGAAVSAALERCRAEEDEREILAPDKLRAALRDLHEGAQGDRDRMASSLRLRGWSEPSGRRIPPTRITAFGERSDEGQVEEGSEHRRVMRMAAITDAATVPERVLRLDFSLLQEVVEGMVKPEAAEVESFARLLSQMVVHEQFRPCFERSEPLILELDRHTAIVPWEMVGTGWRDARRPVCLERQVARQLRTAYARAGELEPRREGRLRALVIGDPTGDLPGALAESAEVAATLRDLGLQVTLLLGRDGAKMPEKLRHRLRMSHRPATAANALKEILVGDHDLVHYSGHATFREPDPSSVGWRFEGRMLTADDIASLRRPPRLVVANACRTGQLSRRARGRHELWEPGSDQAILPTMADQFLRAGVGSYIGTAWPVSDRGARIFAQNLYRDLLKSGAELGAAMLATRRVLHRLGDDVSGIWAAYQHYGDPEFRRADLER